jgi:hypothetical protein
LISCLPDILFALDCTGIFECLLLCLLNQWPDQYPFLLYPIPSPVALKTFPGGGQYGQANSVTLRFILSSRGSLVQPLMETPLLEIGLFRLWKKLLHRKDMQARLIIITITSPRIMDFIQTCPEVVLWLQSAANSGRYRYIWNGTLLSELLLTRSCEILIPPNPRKCQSI